MAFYAGKRVSYPWYTILRAYERETGRAVPLNSGRRTRAEQEALIREKGVWSPSNPTGAAAYSPSAPHIRAGRLDHALDIQHPAVLAFIAWAARKGLRLDREIPQEPWHTEASTEANLVAVARKLRVSKREKLLAELERIRARIRKIGHWTPARKRRANSIKNWLKKRRK